MRSYWLALAIAAVASRAAAAPTPAITGTITTPAPVPQSRVVTSFMVSGITSYTDTYTTYMASGIAASIVAQGSQVNASQVAVRAQSYAVAGDVTLIAIGLQTWSGTTGISTCFANGMSAVSGAPASDISVRIVTQGAAGTVIPFYIYYTTETGMIDGVASTKASFATGASALVSALATCGVNSPAELTSGPSESVGIISTVSIPSSLSAAVADDLIHTVSITTHIASAGVAGTLAVTVTKTPVVINGGTPPAPATPPAPPLPTAPSKLKAVASGAAGGAVGLRVPTGGLWGGDWVGLSRAAAGGGGGLAAVALGAAAALAVSGALLQEAGLQSSIFC